MTQGLDNFETGWSNNQAYLTSFAPTNIQDAGFDTLTFGSLNLMTNVYTPVLDTFAVPVKFVLPNTGKQIIVYIQTQTGAGLDSSVVAISYLNQANTLHTIEVGIGEGYAQGRAFFVPLVSGDTGVLEIANVTRIAGPFRSGVIAIRSPLMLIDDFQTNWGPADVGL